MRRNVRSTETPDEPSVQAEQLTTEQQTKALIDSLMCLVLNPYPAALEISEICEFNPSKDFEPKTLSLLPGVSVIAFTKLRPFFIGDNQTVMQEHMPSITAMHRQPRRAFVLHDFIHGDDPLEFLPSKKKIELIKATHCLLTLSEYKPTTDRERDAVKYQRDKVSRGHIPNQEGNAAKEVVYNYFPSHQQSEPD